MAHSHEIEITPLAKVCAAVLVSLTIFVAVTGDHGGVLTSEEMANRQVVDQMSLTFRDREIGGVEVINARTMAVIDVFEPGTNSFARGVLRSMVHERQASEADLRIPFVLRRHGDGRLTLSDPGTGRVIELVSFGKDNMSVFASFLEMKDAG